MGPDCARYSRVARLRPVVASSSLRSAVVRFGLRSAVKDPDFAGLPRVSGLTGHFGLGFAQPPRASTSPVSSRAPLRSYRRAVSRLFGGGGITPGDSTRDTQPCSSRCGFSMSFDCRGFSTGLGRWDLDSGPPPGSESARLRPVRAVLGCPAGLAMLPHRVVLVSRGTVNGLGDVQRETVVGNSKEKT